MTISKKIIISMSAVFVLAVFFYYIGDNFLLEDVLQESALLKSENTASRVFYRVNLEKETIVCEVKGLEYMYSIPEFTSGKQIELLRQFLDRHPQVVRIGVAHKNAGITYVYNDYSDYVNVNDFELMKEAESLKLLSEQYSSVEQYENQAQTEGFVWSDMQSLQNKYGETVLVKSYVCPIKDYKTDKYIGLIVCDISASSVEEYLRTLPKEHFDYVVIFSKDDRNIFSSDSRLNKYKMLSDFCQNKPLKIDSEDSAAYSGRVGIVKCAGLLDGKEGRFVHVLGKSSSWSVGVFLSDEKNAGLLDDYVLYQLLFYVLGFILILIVLIFVIISVTKPISTLSKAVLKLPENLDAELPEAKGSDEIAELTNSYRIMAQKLKHNIALLEKETRIKERTESDLRIAGVIQKSMLPDIAEIAAVSDRIDVAALLKPSREVGGDFYDFFLIDENYIGIAIGDVSDKGISASLYMTVTATLMKLFALKTKSPAQLFFELNNMLVKRNKNSMFVTMLYIVIDLRTKKAVFANAGHLPPALLSVKNGFSFFPKTKTTLLGVKQDFQFEEKSLDLSDSCVLMYTDGITDAVDKSMAFYGNGRLENILAASMSKSCSEIVENLAEDIDTFSSEMPQSDDIAVVAFKLK